MKRESSACPHDLDIDIHRTEEIMKHDLEFRGLLIL